MLGEEVVSRKADLAPGLQAGLLRLAAFENPEFVRAERMRVGTHGMPWVVACGSVTCQSKCHWGGRNESDKGVGEAW